MLSYALHQSGGQVGFSSIDHRLSAHSQASGYARPRPTEVPRRIGRHGMIHGERGIAMERDFGTRTLATPIYLKATPLLPSICCRVMLDFRSGNVNHSVSGPLL
jgi:hypothetical protein